MHGWGGANSATLADALMHVKQPNVGAAIFNDVAGLMYHLKDVKRQWKNYLANVKLIPVASAASSAAPLQPHDRKPSSAGIVT